MAVQGKGGTVAGGAVPAGLPAHHHGGALESDPVLNFISSRLPSMRLLRAGSKPSAEAAAAAAAGAGAAGSTAATAGSTAAGSSASSMRAVPSGGSASASGVSAGARTISGGASSAGELSPEVQQWEVLWEDLALEKLIGKGSFGRVYLAQWLEHPVAVKLLMAVDECSDESFLLPEGVLRQLVAEAAVLVRMRHPNVVSFLGLCTLPPCILTEYCQRGSLYDVLRGGLRNPAAAAELTWPLRLQMAVDAARGLLYLHRHSPPIIHRDVKSPNLLVDRHWAVKVSDFNLSKIFEPVAGEAAAASSVATNPIWQAPEVMSGERPTAAADVYAFGLVLWELMTWELPWGAASGTLPFQIIYQVIHGERPEVPPREALPGPDNDSFTGLDAYCALMRECWAERPGDRPTFDAIVPRLKALLMELLPGGAPHGAHSRTPSATSTADTTGAVGRRQGLAATPGSSGARLAELAP